MNYVARVLAANEKVRYRARLHWLIWLRAIAALILLGVFIIGIVVFVRDVIFLMTTEVVITDRRLILKTGFFERHARELQLTSVEAANLDQGYWGRLLDFGRIEVHGTGDDVWTTPMIAAPVEFRRQIEEAASSSAGLRGETAA